MSKFVSGESLIDSLRSACENRNIFYYHVELICDKYGNECKVHLGDFKLRKDAIYKAIEFTGCTNYDWSPRITDPNTANYEVMVAINNIQNTVGPRVEYVYGPFKTSDISEERTCAKIQRLEDSKNQFSSWYILRQWAIESFYYIYENIC